MKKFVNKCPICGSFNTQYFTKTYDRHYGHIDKYYDVYKCKNCFLFFLNPMISENELYPMYDPNTYYAYNKFSYKNKNKKVSFSKNFLRIIKKILIGIYTRDPIFHERFTKKVLDFGCGSGSKLYDYKKMGWETYGIEIDKKAAEYGNTLGLNIFNGSINDAKYPPNFFDYIRSNHSFEHLIDPEVILLEMYRVLKKDGKIFIGVPNTKSFAFSFFKKYWYYLGVPFHPYSYNIKNLTLLLERNGFKVIKTRYVGNYQGLLGSLQIWLNRRNKKKSNKGIIAKNMFLKIFFHQIAKILNIFKIGDCIEIIAVKKRNFL